MTKQTKNDKGQKIEQRAKCKDNPSSTLSNSAWCGLSSRGEILNLHDKYPIP